MPLLPYLLAALIAYLAYRANALTADGAIAASFVGGTIFGFGGLPWAILLVLFFLSSSALSFLKSSDARKLKAAQTFEKSGKRDAAQVLANGGIAALLALLSPLATSVLFTAYLGALAAATADTWATEIGVLSNRPPRLIINGQPVPPGTSGGITPLGTLASAAGALFLGLAAALLAALPGFNAPTNALTLLTSAFVGGITGSLADSLLGATLQASYWCPHCHLPTESPTHKCGTTTQLTKGIRALNNDLVNLLATATGAATSALIWLAL